MVGVLSFLYQRGFLVICLRQVKEEVLLEHDPKEAGIREEKNITPVKGCRVSSLIAADWSKSWNESDRDHQDVDYVHNVVVVLHSVFKTGSFWDIIITHHMHERKISASVGTQNKEVEKENVSCRVVEDQNSNHLKLR